MLATDFLRLHQAFDRWNVRRRESNGRAMHPDGRSRWFDDDWILFEEHCEQHLEEERVCTGVNPFSNCCWAYVRAVCVEANRRSVQFGPCGEIGRSEILIFRIWNETSNQLTNTLSDYRSCFLSMKTALALPTIRLNVIAYFNQPSQTSESNPWLRRSVI